MKSTTNHNIQSFQIKKATIKNQIDHSNARMKKSIKLMLHFEKLKLKSYIKNLFSNKLKNKYLMTFMILSCEKRVLKNK